MFVTRFPFRTKILYDWDSVQFALGMRHFDVSLFQPHPPGYLFYVMSAKAVNFFVHDENVSLVLLSILGSAITLYFTFLLGMQMFSKEVSVAATALLFTSPLFWMFGLIGNPDIFDAAFSAWFAYLAWRILKGERHLLPWLSFLFGISIGFRTGLLIFLSPLWLYAVAKCGRQNFIKNFFASSLIILCVVLLWLLPSVFLSGGFHHYFQSLKNSSASFTDTSIFKAGLDGFAMNFGMLSISVVFGGLCFFSLHYWLFPTLSMFLNKEMRNRNKAFVEKYGGKRSLLSLKAGVPDAAWFYVGGMEQFKFYFAWLLPATLFLCFIHDRTPAFALFFLPALFLQTTFLAFSFYKDFHAAAKAKISAGLFFAPFMAVFFLLNTWASAAFVTQFVRYNNQNWMLREKYVKTHFHKDKTLLVTSYYAFEECQACDINFFRHAMIYLQDYKVYFLPEVFNAHSSKKAQMAEHGNAKTLLLTKKSGVYEVPLPNGIREVVFIEDMFFNMFSFVRRRYPGSVTRYNVSRKHGILFFGIKIRGGQKSIFLPQKEIFIWAADKRRK